MRSAAYGVQASGGFASPCDSLMGESPAEETSPPWPRPPGVPAFVMAQTPGKTIAPSVDQVAAVLQRRADGAPAGWVEAGLVCQACAGDAPGGKCQRPQCVGRPIVRELVPDEIEVEDPEIMINGLTRALQIVEAEIARAESLLNVEDGGNPVFDRAQTEAGIAALRTIAAAIERERTAGVPAPREVVSTLREAT